MGVGFAPRSESRSRQPSVGLLGAGDTRHEGVPRVLADIAAGWSGGAGPGVSLATLHHGVGNRALARLLQVDPSSGRRPSVISPARGDQLRRAPASPGWTRRSLGRANADDVPRELGRGDVGTGCSLQSAELSGNARIADAACNNPPLGAGEQSDGVAILQGCLAKLGLPLPRSAVGDGSFDGIYGSETEAAVAAFQVDAGIPLPTGRQAGRRTLSRLDGRLAGAPAPPFPPPVIIPPVAPSGNLPAGQSTAEIILSSLPAPTNLFADESEKTAYRAAMAQLSAFSAKKHAKDDFHPSTAGVGGFGNFNVEYNVQAATLGVSFPFEFRFSEGLEKDWAVFVYTLKDGRVVRARAGEAPPDAYVDVKVEYERRKEQWTPMRAASVRASVRDVIQRTWNAPRFVFHCQNDWWEAVKVMAVIRVDDVTEVRTSVPGRYIVEVRAGSSLGPDGMPVQRDRVTPHGATLFEGDITGMLGVGTLAHEAGHMLGLDDEYIEPGAPDREAGAPVGHAAAATRDYAATVVRGGNPSSLMMSVAGMMQGYYGVGLLEALRAVTKDDGARWAPIPKPPRAPPLITDPSPIAFPSSPPGLLGITVHRPLPEADYRVM